MATKYWVGNGGNWSDTAHWSLSSGGAGGAGAPSSEDEVYFDENSFTAPNQTVTADTDVEVAGFYYNLIGYGTVDDDVAGIVLNFSGRIIAFADSNIRSVSSAFNFTNAIFSGRFCFGYYTLVALELLDITNCTFTLTESTGIIIILHVLEPVAPVGYQLSIYTLNYIFLDQVDHGQINLNSDVDIYIENLNIVNLTTYPPPEENWLTESNELYWTIDGQHGPEGGTTVTVKNFNFGWDVRQQDLVTDGAYSRTDYRDISSSAPFGFTIENFVKDKSVLLLGAEHVVLQRVLSDPQLNEYTVSESGEYTFNSGNAGAGVLLDYVFTEEPSGPLDVKSIVFNFDTPYQFMYHLCVTRLDANLVLLDPTPPPEPVFATPKGVYNEGDHFAYAPGDSGGTAVWREPSASSTPVTPTHRPGCGYWFKEVGTIYGGEVGPWVPWNVDQKVEFNEGSKIVKSPAVSGGTPIWEVGKTGPAITDTHVPCGYWFKDYDSDSQLRRICFGLEMGYTKTDMVVDEQQTLYVKDSNGDTVACPITVWTLSGVGSLSESLGPTTVYTAPSYSESGADSATITLWCGGAVKDTLVISIAHSCDCLDTIQYTSLQMSINQQQTLTASGGQSDKCYTWTITSGGGSLSAATGKSVVYTAPSSNADCASNSTIALTCDRSVVDTVTIAVNQVTSIYAAYEFNDECEQGCRIVGARCEYYYQYLKTKYTCNGDVYSGPTIMSIQTSSVGCAYTDYPSCTNLKNNCDGVAHCVAAGGCCNDYIHGFVDLRTPAQKAAGCCPAGLL